MTDFCCVAYLAGFTSKRWMVLKGFFAAFWIYDCVCFTRPQVDTLINLNGYITWVGNACTARNVHSVAITLTMITMLIMGIVILRRSKLKRQKRFIYSFFIANILMLVGSFPDTFLVMNGQYGLPTSGLGAAACVMVLRYLPKENLGEDNLAKARAFAQLCAADTSVFEDKDKLLKE